MNLKEIMLTKKQILCSILLLFLLNCYAKDKYPQDISKFIEKRDQCDYLRGEISGELEVDSDQDLNMRLDKSCKGTDEALALLKNKYKNNREITDKLNSYDSTIESHTNSTSSDLFNKFLFNIYHGKTIPPKGYVQKNDIWFDDLGKAVNPPTINFAGRYNLGLHSCGYGCRYYTLTNLADGKDFSDILENFVSSPENDKINNYFIELFSQPDSNLLLARYYKTPESEIFQDCYFIFDNNKIRKIKDDIICPIFD